MSYRKLLSSDTLDEQFKPPMVVSDMEDNIFTTEHFRNIISKTKGIGTKPESYHHRIIAQHHQEHNALLILKFVVSQKF